MKKLISIELEREIADIIIEFQKKITEKMKIGNLTYSQINTNYNINSTGPVISTKVEISRTEESKFYIENKNIIK